MHFNEIYLVHVERKASAMVALRCRRIMMGAGTGVVRPRMNDGMSRAVYWNQFDNMRSKTDRINYDNSS